MSRYIDGDALAKFIDYGHLNNPDDKCYSENDIREMIDMMPTQPVDAVPVRHGKWTADETLYTQGMAVCSCCKAEYYRDDLYMVGNGAQGEPPKYCPNCGARMDKE